MNEIANLAEAYGRCAYPISGHGRRTVKVLLDALTHAGEHTESEMYGKGKPIEDFQAKMAGVLGKPTAVFFPSGTMAQQIALRIWCDRRQVKTVAYHPLCHLEIHEEKGLQELHGIETVLLADEERTIGLADVLGLKEEIACLLLELPQREIGGQLPPYEELEAISAFCRNKGIKLHLDGARLFEILPYYRKSAAEVCALFDSVYVSFYKGIGGVAGAILAGEETFAAESKIWKRRHGGDLISLYPYYLSADYYYELRHGKMDRYYREAIELAAKFNACRGLETRPMMPVSNMFHVHAAMPVDAFARALADVCEATGVGFAGSLQAKGPDGCRFEISLGDRYADVPEDKLDDALRRLEEKIRAALKEKP